MQLPAWKRTLYIIWFTQFIAIAGVSMVFPFLPLYLEDLGVHEKSSVTFYAGLSGLSIGLASFLFSPLWGALADRFGRKPLLIRAYAGAMLATFLQSFNHSLPLFFVYLAMQGAFSGTPAAAAALLASSSPRDKVAYSLGLLQVSMFVSGVTGPLIGGVLAGAIGFRLTFLIASMSFLTAGILVFFTIKEDFQPPAVRRGPVDIFLGNLREAASSAAVMKIIGFIFLINATGAFGRQLIPLFVKALDPGGASVHQSSYAFAAIAVTSAMAAFMAGNMASKVGFRRLLVITLVGAGLALVPVAIASSVAMLIAMLAVVGVFNGGSMPAASALLSVNAPQDKQGSVFGFSGSAQSLAFAVAPFAAGIIGAAFGIRIVFLITGLATLATGILASRILPQTEIAPDPEIEVSKA